MTENNSDFIEEPSVGNSNSVDFCQETIQTEVSCDGKETKNHTCCNDSPIEDVICEKNEKHESCSKLVSCGCEDELHSLQDHCLKLSTLFRKVYHAILDDEKPPDVYECHVNIVRELIANDPHQLFARLEMDLQEFTIEIKLRQMEFLNCVHAEEGPHLFIFCLIEGYNKLMFAANALFPLLLQLEIEHLATFNISWRGLHQHLFYKIVFTEPKIQKVLPFCISKLGKMNSELSDFNKMLIRQFLTFDDEMTKIGEKWEDTESSVIKYHQENSMLDAKQRMIKVDWELIKTQTKLFHEELKSSGISSEIGSDILNNSSDVDVTISDYTRNHETCDNGIKCHPVKDTSYHIKTLTENFKKMKVELQNLHDQQLCDCCTVNTTHFVGDSIPLTLESYVETKSIKTSAHSNCEETCNDTEIFKHTNADSEKLCSHARKINLQQIINEHEQESSIRVPPKDNKDSASSVSSSDPAQQQNTQPVQQSPSVSPEIRKTIIRKQIIHQPRQPHQKKLVQITPPSQQKISKQWQEHQVLIQQQRKIDDRHTHLFSQRSVHLDKEMQKKINLDKEIQKKVHLQMQQRFVQKHKQMEEKYNRQKQQMEQHQDEESSAPKSDTNENGTQPKVLTCNYSKQPITTPQKFNHNCTVTTASAPTSTTSTAVSNTPVSSAVNTIVFTSKTITSTAGSNNSTNVTLKNSTTQTAAAPVVTNGQNRVRHHPLPDVVKSSSYVCPKHSESNKQNIHNLRDESNSSDSFTDDDYSSERSSSPQRHCDCCYCEVFGSAPVSRNFQETRERLRLILTRKKAISNSTANSGDTPAKDTPCSLNIANSTQSAASQCSTNKIKKEDAVDKKMNAPAEYKGDKSIEEILDFIEGNKSRNIKRIAKKLRRKQRMIEEEERIRKEQEEAERLRQEELRRKEEEERRRLEKEKRKQELLFEQNRKKNKKKNGKQTNQQKSVNTSATVNQSGKNKCKNQFPNDKSKINNNQKNYQEQQSHNKNQKQNTTSEQLSAKQNNQGIKNQIFQKQNNSLQQQQHHQTKVQNKKKIQDKQKITQQFPKNNTQKKSIQQNQQRKPDNEKEDDSNSGQPQMVTIKRVIQPNSAEPTVTITLRGPTPKEDKVLYTLLNGQMCQVKDEKNKKPAPSPAVCNNNNKKNIKYNNDSNNFAGNYNNYSISNVNTQPPKTTNFPKSYNIVGNGVNSITDRIDRLKLGPQPVFTEPVKKFSAPVSQAELTTPTAIQINQAVNQLSTRPTFPNNFDLENIKLPPGITITKVDPATVQRKPIQVKQQQQQQPPHIPPPQSQAHIRQTMMPSAAGATNVIVVDTSDKNNTYYSDDQMAHGGKKKRRRRNKKDRYEMNRNDLTNATPYGTSNGLPARMDPMNAGNVYGAGNPFMSNDYKNVPQQSAAIIQMNGSMVTIRNPALHQALSRQQMDYHDGNKMTKNVDTRDSNIDENVFSSPPEEIENGDVDEYERELEAFKRFCSQSVPAESKAKVNLNIEDIVLKKKGPVIGCS